MPRFSILLATRNRPGWLPRAVESVLAQTFTDWELVILDNGDALSAGFMDEALDSRIVYAWRECAGVADAFNQALELATGEIVTPLADDDRLPPNILELADRAFRRQACEWLYAITDLQDQSGHTFDQRGHRPFNLDELRAGYYLGGAVYWRRDLTDRLGGFDTRYEGAADYDLYLRFAEHADPHWLQEVGYLYTAWPGTDSNVRAANQAFQTARIREAHAATLNQ